ncbi:hypothetical protein ABI59_08340 [Acidobacteria bacterium Mor1]|nr:hypothetical protein ABI59_08340 [Acidobacteria bacterium Mor1]
MRKTTLALSLIGLALTALASLPCLAAEGFMTDRKAAFKQATQDDRPLLIDFQTTWCVACRTMEKTTWVDTDVVAAMGAYVPLMVDGERDHNLVARYRVEAYPTIVIATPDGAPILTLVGLQTAEQMKAHLAAVTARLDDLAAWASAASSRKPEPVALLGLADFALSRDSGGEAERMFRDVLRRKKGLDPGMRRDAQLGLARALIELDECKDAGKLLDEIDSRDSGDDSFAGRLEQARVSLGSCES